jgi:hypothetical protein
VLEESNPSPRHALYREVASLVRPLPTDERDEVVGELRRWAGVVETGRESHRSLTEREVAELAASRFVEVGAHTVSHPVLARLSPRAQLSEITESRDTVRELAGGPVDSFAYPYGGETDYSSTTVRLLREAGFATGLTTIRGGVVAGINPLQMPRVLVRDWDSIELHRTLAPFVRR